MNFCSFLLLLSTAALFAADKPKLGDLLPVEQESCLIDLNTMVKNGDLVLVKNADDKWQYAKFCEMFGEGVCAQVAITNKRGHGSIFFLKEVKSLSDKGDIS